MNDRKPSELIQHFNRSRPLIVGYFVNKGFSPQDSEDLVQETFLQALRSLDGFRGAAEFKTWIFKIAQNLARKAFRTRKAAKRNRLQVSLDDAPQGSMDKAVSPWAIGRSTSGREGEQFQILLTQEVIDRVMDALNRLPVRMRSCIFLYVFQERKYREIAELMNLSINTVKSQIHEARKRLKANLGDDLGHLGF